MKIFKYFAILASASLVAHGVLAAPTYDNYQGLEAKGPMPQCFASLSTDKYTEAMKTVTRDDSRLDRKSKKEFYLYSNFVIDDILLSGKVCYGDPVTQYINEVADYLLRNDPELRKKIQFFTTKSQYTNAFATDQGIIFVNTGLIARLHSEAELAFVLGHEISHYVEKHAINAHIEKERMVQHKGSYRNMSVGKEYLNVNQMSKENETEADEKAYTNYYKSTEYDLSELDSIFASLLLSEMPFFEIPFRPSFFESEYYRFPASYTDTSRATVSLAQLSDKAEQRESQSVSTHPATADRRKYMDKLKVKESNNGRKRFILPEERFREIQTICRFECIRQMMIDQEYIDAIYNCYGMLQELPHHAFLESTLASALYIYSRYSVHGEQNTISDKYTKQSNEILGLSYFLRKLKADELSVLALRYLAGVTDRHGMDGPKDKMLDQLTEELIFEHKIKRADLFTKEELLADINMNNPAKPENKLYYLNAFDEAFEYDFFNNKLNTFSQKKIAADKREEEQKQKSKKQQRKEERLEERLLARENRYEKRYGKSLGIDTLVVVDPFYYKFKPRLEQPLLLIESEQNQLRLCNRIDGCAQNSALKVHLLNAKEFDDNGTEEFNNMSVFKEWLDERLEYDSDFDIIPYSSRFVANTTKHYSSQHIMLTGVVSEREKKRIGPAFFIVVPTYGLALPFILAWAVIPKYNTNYYAFVFDVETGETKLSINRTMSTSDLSGDFVNKMTFDTFQQVNKKKK